MSRRNLNLCSGWAGAGAWSERVVTSGTGIIASARVKLSCRVSENVGRILLQKLAFPDGTCPRLDSTFVATKRAHLAKTDSGGIYGLCEIP